MAELPPNRVDLAGRTLETTLPVTGGARTVRISESSGSLELDVVSGRLSARAGADLAKTVAHMFRLDEDLSGFYAICAADGELGWCVDGAGRMLRAPTVFEDVVKTICTTNTSWSGTTKMTTALVENLGIEAPAAGVRSRPRRRWRRPTSSSTATSCEPVIAARTSRSWQPTSPTERPTSRRCTTPTFRTTWPSSACSPFLEWAHTPPHT